MASEHVKLAVRHVNKSFRIRGRREAEDRILSVLGVTQDAVTQGEQRALVPGDQLIHGLKVLVQDRGSGAPTPLGA